MAGERNYLRVPPDSTGKRVRLKHSAQLTYTGKTIGYQWKPDNYYDLVSSGWEIHVHEIHETNSTSGYLDISYDAVAEFNNLAPASGEGIRDQVTNTIIATAGTVTDVFNNTTNIVGFENPTNGLDIDNTGSANIRFYEGNPQLDAFGKLRVSGATLLGEYIFSSGTLPTQFSSILRNGGTVTWDNNSRALVLTNTTTNDSHTSHTTNTYHHYYPGSSQLFIGTFALGDTGKMGLMREWGMFDDKNGLFFMQDDGVLGVGIRSNASGSVSQMFIPQTDWNVDKADGTGRSQMILDVTKDNIYWIDVQWLGAGRARFGTYYNGQRVVLYEYYHGNNYSVPITAMGSLPACVHQMNMTATGSSSEIRAWCIAVWTESNLDVRTSASTSLQSFSKTISANDVYTYMGALSPKELLPNGQPNRSLYWPTEIECSGWDTVTGAPAIFELEIYAEPVLSNLVWTSVGSGSTVEYDTGGTFVASGTPVSKRFVQGKDSIDTTSVFNNMQYGAFKNYSEDGGTVVQPITNITQANPAVVTLAGSRTFFRDGEPMTISNVGGMTSVNGNTYYVTPLTANTVALYTNSTRTTSANTISASAYTSGGTGSGTFGPKFHFGILVTKLFGTNPIKVYVKVSWKEITQ